MPCDHQDVPLKTHHGFKGFADCVEILKRGCIETPTKFPRKNILCFRRNCLKQWSSKNHSKLRGPRNVNGNVSRGTLTASRERRKNLVVLRTLPHSAKHRGISWGVSGRPILTASCNRWTRCEIPFGLCRTSSLCFCRTTHSSVLTPVLDGPWVIWCIFSPDRPSSRVAPLEGPQLTWPEALA